MAWVLLVAAGVLEVGWAFAMKQSAGFTRLWPSVATLAGMVASFALLAIAMRSLPLGTAYAIWTGIGAAGALAVGVLMLGEQVTPLRLAGAAMLLGGVAILKIATPES